MGLWVTSRSESAFLPLLEHADIVDGIRHLPSQPCVVIVPTTRQAEIVLRAWAQHNGHGEPPIIETMASFLRRLGQHLLTDGTTILNEDLVDVLLRHVVADSSMLQSIGLEAQKLVRWTQYGVTPAAVDELADKAGLHTRRGRLLAEIAAAWKRLYELYSGLACDRGAYELLVQKSLSTIAERPLRNASGDEISACVMIATHGVTPADKELLAALAEFGWDVGIGFAAELAPVDGVSDMISASATDAAWYVANGWHHGWCGEQLPEYELVVTTLPSREEEVRRIMASIKHDVAEGVSLRDIAICVPGASMYRQIIDDHARRAGVPLEAKRHITLAATPAATAVRAICDLVIRRWLRDDLERLLSHGSVMHEIRGNADLLHVARNERILGGEGVRGWQIRLDAIASSCSELLKNDAINPDEQRTIERRLRRAERASTAINSIALVVPSGDSEPLPAAAFALSVRTAIDGMGLAARQQEECEQLVNCLDLYTGLAERHGLQMLTFQQHAEHWWRLVASAASRVERASGAGVPVVAPAELRCRPWQRVYVLGMVEGEFPRVHEHITDREIIPGVLERMYAQAMTDIAYAVQSGGRLVITRPKHVDRAVTLPSSLIDVLGRTPSVTIPPMLDVQHRIAVHSHELPPINRDVYRAPQCATINGIAIPELRERIEQERSRPLSPSRLDLYSQCPYRFYAEKILRLRQVDIHDAKLSPLERGTMLHDVAAEFFRSLQPAVQYDSISSVDELLSLSVRLDPANVNAYWQQLQMIAHQRMGTQEWQHAYAMLDRHALFGTDERPGLLLQWLHLEIAYQQATGHYPTLLEIAIDEDLVMPSMAGSGTLRVSTRVDRIDVGFRDGCVTFVVNDYKATASTGYGLAEIQSGQLSQMPIYLEATRLWLEHHGIRASPAAAVYRSFGKALHVTDDPVNKIALVDPSFDVPKDAVGIKTLKPTTASKEFLEKPLVEQNHLILEVVGEIASGLHAGLYAVRPAGTDACRTCDVQELCRIEQWGNG